MHLRRITGPNIFAYLLPTANSSQLLWVGASASAENIFTWESDGTEVIVPADKWYKSGHPWYWDYTPGEKCDEGDSGKQCCLYVSAYHTYIDTPYFAKDCTEKASVFCQYKEA